MTKLLNVSVLKLLSVQFIVTSALMTTGCSSLNVQEQVKPTQATLTIKCPILSKHEGTTGTAVLLTLTSWASEYNECATRHNGLVDAINQTEK